MSTRLNSLLIGKIRHNLKTHLNIICGFSELLVEELESEEYQEDSALATELSKISELGGNIALEIDQVFSAHNFSLDGFFSQLSTQSISLNGIVSPLLHKINAKLSKIKQGSVTGFDFLASCIACISSLPIDMDHSGFV